MMTFQTLLLILNLRSFFRLALDLNTTFNKIKATKMKTLQKLMLLLMLTFLSFGVHACSNDQDVPQKVKQAFTTKFPAAKKVKWEKENESEWEAEFKMDGLEYSANFSEDGSWQETEHEIKKNEVPANILSILNAEFPGYKIEEAEISETAEGKFYEFELEKGGEDIEVTLDLQGKIVNKEASRDDEE
jgi:uncharacterized membrane protein YkoI